MSFFCILIFLKLIQLLSTFFVNNKLYIYQIEGNGKKYKIVVQLNLSKVHLKIMQLLITLQIEK